MRKEDKKKTKTRREKLCSQKKKKGSTKRNKSFQNQENRLN